MADRRSHGPEDRYPPLPPPSIGRIPVRILALEPGEHDDDIVSRLQVTTIPDSRYLGNVVPYDALSYAFGSDHPTYNVGVDAWNVRIRENLWLALHQIRHLTEQRFLWIDSLCINLHDADERAAQVQLMDKIYSGARRVLVWLGPGDDDSVVAMKVIRESTKTTSGCIEISLSDHQALINWAQRPYWNRTWVTRDDSEIINVSREKDVEFHDMYSAKLIDCRRLEHSKILGRSIKDVHISEDLGLLALLSWRDEAELYDLRSLDQPRGRVSHFVNIWLMAVNPLKKMLAMSTCDGELFTVGAQSLKKVQVKKAVNASRMAVSTDGRTLVAGTTHGAILIFDFDSLEELYALPFDEEEVIALRFTQSSLRFLDIRPHVFNVWEPSALVRRDHYDDAASTADGSSFTTAASHGSEVTAKIDNTAITAMAEHDSGDFVFCAKRSGAVSFYDTSKGRWKLKLFDFGKTEVLSLAWNKAQNLLASADNSGTIKLHHVAAKMEKVPGGRKETWQANLVRQIKPIEQEHPIRQVLLSLDGDLLLVSTTTKDFVFSTKDGSELLSHDCESHLIGGQPAQKWVTCPSTKQRFLEVQKGRCDAIKVKPPDSQHPILKHIGFADELYPDTVHYGKACLVPVGDQSWVAHDSDPSSAPVVWPQKTTATLSDNAREAARAKLLSRFADVAPQIVSFLGIYKGCLVFLGADNWISSFRVDEARSNDLVKHHFPIPHYWRNPNQTLLAFVTVKGEIVIAVEGDLAVVKNALL